MNFKHLSGPDDARKLIAGIVAEHRARRFAGTTDEHDPIQPTGDANTDERTEYVLQALHATLSAHRTVWSTFEMLRTAIRIETGHELSDSALSYIADLAASGVVDLVTHEHVAQLLAIKEPPAPAAPGAVG